MKTKKIIVVILIVTLILSLIPISIFAVGTLNLTITPDKAEAHPGDEITYTVKMSAVENLAGMKFKLSIPEGLTFIEGSAVEGLQTTLNAAKAEFTAATKIFIVGSSNYTSESDTTLMTFKCSVDSESNGNKAISFIIDEDDIFDTSYDNIPTNYTNTGSDVNITPAPVPATGVTLNKNTLTLEEGEQETLLANVSPDGSTDTLTWTSDNGEKATVNTEGKVTAVTEGNATIIVTTTSGQSDTCVVTVIKPVCKHLSKTTVPEKAATCTETGNNEYKTCDNCGKVFKADGTTETTIEAETTQALGHDFSVANHDSNQHWNECSRCHIADTKVNHVGEGEWLKNATNHWKVCGCGVKVEESAHTGATAVIENKHAATCTVAGTYDEVVYCSVCNYEMSRTQKTESATGHTEGTPVKENIHAATCTAAGSYDEVIYCTICGDEVSRTQKTEPAKGHTEGTPVKENIVDPTCSTKGSYDEVVYCTVCGGEVSRIKKETDMIPHDVSGVNWTKDATTHWKECGCGVKVEESAHTGATAVIENKHAATCTVAGTYDEVVYCSVCNYEMSRTQKTESATGHTEGSSVEENIVKPTCTKDGKHDEVVYCTVCGDEISRVTKNDKATGHTEGTPVKENIKDATCTEVGSYDEVVYCSVCNEKISTNPKEIKAKGHTEGTPVIENEVEATVSKEGSYDEVIYCSVCKKELSRTKKTIPKFVYEIIEGANSTHEDETGDTITIKANGKFEKFRSIKVDENEVDKKHYTAKSGSTIITLNADYLNTLSIGEHKIMFVYDDGEVGTTFKVAENIKNEVSNDTKNNPSTPKTGDSSNITLWIVGLTISGILFVIALGCKIRRKETK